MNTSPRWRVEGMIGWDARLTKVKQKRNVSGVIHGALQGLLKQENYVGTICVCEDAGARPTDAVSRAHGFGLGRGIAEGVLREKGFKLVYTSPSQWKRHLGLTFAPKRASVELARIFAQNPKLTLTRDEDSCEALLLAVWYALREACRGIDPKGHLGLF